MGKKYNAYVKAVEAHNQAKGRAASAQGGSTAEHLQQCYNDVEQARRAEEDTWGQVMQDPEG